jgi:hypothetical protein
LWQAGVKPARLFDSDFCGKGEERLRAEIKKEISPIG